MAQEAEDHGKEEMVADLVSKEPGTDVHTLESSATDNRNDTETLQEAFEKFRKKRQEELHDASVIHIKLHQVTNTVQQWELRQKFIEQAKNYIGVPYAQKSNQPGTPEYKTPLFRDSGGLVRRVVRDLRDDFGFIIHGNKSYMYDTLPNIRTQETMEPGDLVFVSGKTLNPKAKLQLHNIVHVEIWFGDGEKTLGARPRNGKVQIFDSYKFVSPLYENMEFHFKSIDTWLQGNCMSHCREHKWDSLLKYIPSKWSIFALEDDTEDKEADVTLKSTEAESPNHDILSSTLAPKSMIPKQILIHVHESTETFQTLESSSQPTSDSMEDTLQSVTLRSSNEESLDRSVLAQNNPTKVSPQTHKQTEKEVKGTGIEESEKTLNSVSDIVSMKDNDGAGSPGNTVIRVIYSKVDTEVTTQCMKCKLRANSEANLTRSEISGSEKVDENVGQNQASQTSQLESSSTLGANNSNMFAVRFLQHELLYIFCPLFLAFALELLAVYLFVP